MKVGTQWEVVIIEVLEVNRLQHSLLDFTRATQTIDPIKKCSTCARKTNSTNEVITSVAMQENSQMTQVNWRPSALVARYKQLHRRKSASLKQCFFDWCRWLVVLHRDLRCAASVLLLCALLALTRAFLAPSAGPKKCSSVRCEK